MPSRWRAMRARIGAPDRSSRTKRRAGVTRAAQASTAPGPRGAGGGKVRAVGTEPTLHIRLLGGLSLVHGDQAVTAVHSPRLHSLLGYLLLHRDAPQLRQHLAFTFWPDSSEAQARNNLRQILHELRHALPESERFLFADTPDRRLARRRVLRARRRRLRVRGGRGSGRPGRGAGALGAGAGRGALPRGAAPRLLRRLGRGRPATAAVCSTGARSRGSPSSSRPLASTPPPSAISGACSRTSPPTRRPAAS